MRRRNWLIAIAAALFVLQAPLCALACLPSADSTITATAEHADSPCHEKAPGSTPSEPAKSHDDCGCADSYKALAPSPAQTLANIPSLALLAPRSRTAQLPTSVPWVPHTQLKETDLPPPDVLLLKSTLLI